jgi:outer membrane lipoprotein-sorting protein
MGAVLNRKAAIAIASLLLGALTASAQSPAIKSADSFFSDLSVSYGKVKDYEANLTITRGKDVQTGRLSYKSPLFLNVRFDNPKDQVINFDGEKLTIYNPVEQVVLEQTYKARSPTEIAGLVSSQGLTLWQRNYSIAYLTGPDPVPLEDGSREMVVKLRLEARGVTSYSQIIVSVSRDLVKDFLLIRRVEGTLAAGGTVVFDFTGVRLNQGIPDSRFAYTAPPYANVQPDWLFDPEQ